MNKRIERCTMAAAMALGSMAIAGLLNTAQADCRRSSIRDRCSTSAAASGSTNPRP